MKKAIVTLFAVLACTFLRAEGLTFFGIDFSHVKVFGADETPEEFSTAFRNINLLMIYEADKYDFNRVFNVKVATDLEPTRNINAKLKCDSVYVYSTEVRDLPLEEIVKAYELDRKEGTGFIVIPHFLDKSRGQGSHYAVVFDIASREILKSVHFVKRAGGFGLRNYWARTIFEIIRTEKITL